MIALSILFLVIAAIFLIYLIFRSIRQEEITYLKNLNHKWQVYLEDSRQTSRVRFNFNTYDSIAILGLIILAFIIKAQLIFIPLFAIAAVLLHAIFKKFFFLKSLRLQLEELFPFIYTSLKSGLTIDRAIASASEKFPSPAQDELKKIVRAQSLGISLAHCFKILSEKLNSEELQLLSFSLDLSQKTGTPLSGLLETIYLQIREKREFKRKIVSLSSQGKTQGYVAMAMPVLFLIGIGFVAPSMLTPLLRHALGPFILSACVIIMGVASWLIYKITHFKEA